MLAPARSLQKLRSERRFAAAGARAPDKNRAVLFVLRGPQQGCVFSVPPAGAVIGRDARAALQLTSPAVVGRHARVRCEGERFLVEPIAGDTILLGDDLVQGAMRLSDGDRLRFGDDTIVKFCLMDEIEEHALHALFELTLLDPLTRLFNRRHLTDRLRVEFSYAKRHAAELAVLFIDIDHFKRVNDTHGHQVGDRALKLVSANIARILRPEDVFGRYGGEEFVVVARNTSQRNAEILAERIRRSTERLALRIGLRELRVTVSIGVAAVGPRGYAIGAQGLLEVADEALYRAKDSGRNCVVVAPGLQNPA